jgi:hypothetical protein
MLFIAENDLEKALVAATKDPSAAPEFYRLLLESDLLVLGTMEGQEDTNQKVPLTPGGRLNLIPGQKDGFAFLPVFSSLPRMQEYLEQERKYLSINGRALLDLTRGAPVMLNPASEYGRELSPQQVQQLLDDFSGASPVRMGTTVYPTELVEALRALFADRPDIENAWMIQGNFFDGTQRPLVGIALDAKTGGSWSSLMQAIQGAAQSALPGLAFDIERVDPRNPTGLTNAFLQSPPFYQRRTPSSGGFTLN